MAAQRPNSAMTTRFTHLAVGRSPGSLRPLTLISPGLMVSSGMSGNVGSACGLGAPTEIGGATCTCGCAATCACGFAVGWTCGATGEAAGSWASGGAFSACAASSDSIAKTSCGSVSFSVDCIGGPLLSPMSPAAAASMLCGVKPLCPGKPFSNRHTASEV